METPSDARSSQGADQHETFGRYRLLERIGRGGMAEVFKAKSFGVEGFEKILVIKRILPELVASKRFVDLFVHEAKLAVRLSHANIVQVFDLGKVETGPLPQYFIAMEHVAGLDLATLLARGKRRGITFPLGMSAYIAAEVAKGLDHAHRRRDEQMRPLRIVHRDVSPQNVLLSWEGEVKVTDFGIAKARDTLDERPEDEAGGIVLHGKYGYMSPEQALGQAVDARSDIFSLGTVLYESIGGVHPFSAATPEETLRRVRAAEYPPLEIVRPDVPKELAAIVSKALSKEPGDRYSDAGRMHEELLAFLYSSAARFGPNDLSSLLAEFRDPSPGIVVELGAEGPEETRPHPRSSQSREAPTQKLPAVKPEALRLREAKLRYGKFVGQRQNLSRLGEIFALATRRKAQVVTLRGEGGLGKTRFLQEVERRLRRGNLDVAFYVIACPPEGALHPLSGMTAMLRAIAGFAEGTEPSRIEELAPRLRALGLREDEVGAVLAQLGAPGKEATTGLLRSAFARMVTKLSSDQLHVFAWDDAHELDADTIALLDAALPRMAGARAVFLLAGRPSFAHALERLTAHHALSLGPLDPTDVEQLVAARTGVRQVPSELVTFCQERAGGHPLFIEELLRELFVRGLVVVEHGGVTKLELAEAATLPDTLEKLLATRFDELPEDARAVLEAVAALGDAADAAWVAEMTGMAKAELDAALASLEGEHLVVRKSDDVVAFVAPKVRDALWMSLDEEAKRRLRSMAATAYEATLTGVGREQQASVIARHFLEAGESDRAATYFALAASRSMALGQWEGAARSLSLALRSCEPSRRSAEELAEWLERFAEAMHRVRAADAPGELAARLLVRIDEAGDERTRVRVRLDLARAFGAMHLFEEADEHLAAARKLSDKDDALTRRALLCEGELGIRQGDFRRSLLAFEQASRLASSATRAETTRILGGLAQSLAATGQAERALATMDRADQLLETSDLPGHLENTKLRALVHFSTGDFEKAARESERAIQLARDLGVDYEVAINLHNLGDALLRLGDAPRAYANFQQSLSIFDDLGQERMVAQNRGYLAYLDALQGGEASQKAERTLEEAIGYAAIHGYTWDEVNGRYLLALLHERKGDADAARRELSRTRDLADSIGFGLVVRDCAAALARLEGATPAG